MKPEEKKENYKAYSFPFDENDRKIEIPRKKKVMYQIKSGPKEYSWPCEDEPDRKITVTTDDLFSKLKDGTVIKHTGVGCYGIIIPDEDLIEIY